MRKALGLPMQRARTWYRRYGRLGALPTSRSVRPGSYVAGSRTLEDWARFGGGLLAPDPADGPHPDIRASTERLATVTPVSPPS